MASDNRRYPASLQGLLRFCAEGTKSEDASGESSFEPLSDEKKLWLKEALNAITSNDPVKKMIESVKVLLKPSSEDTDEKIIALEDITINCEEIDLANDFYKIGGFEILPLLLNDSHSDLRWRAAELTATLAQNNPYCQEKLLGSGDILPLLLKKLSDEKETDDVKIKCLYAISCLTRESSMGQDEFTKIDGFRVLLKLLHSDVEKLRSKSAFMIGSLCVESNKVKELLCELGVVQELIDLLHQEPHTPSHEHATIALSNIVQDYPLAKEECSKPSHGLKQLIVNRKKQLAVDDAYQEEVEHLDRLLQMISK